MGPHLYYCCQNSEMFILTFQGLLVILMTSADCQQGDPEVEKVNGVNGQTFTCQNQP